MSEGIVDVSGRSLAELQSLAGRVAVVTGGARGIGLAIVRRLAEAGAAVVIADRDAVAAVSAAETVSAEFAGRAIGIELDVTDRDQTENVTAQAVARLGALDVWVNNAAVYPPAELLDLGDDEWDLVLDVNLKGVFIGSQVAARTMLATRSGVIVNIASVSGLRSRRGGPGHYTASKHGVIGLTKSLAAELGPQGIRVLAVAPGTTMTEGVEEQIAGDPERDAWIRGIGRNLPLGRLATPDDIARVVVFCAGDMATFMTGATVVVDGGDDAMM